MASKKDFKSTINLPLTDFSMKANLPQREPQILKRWEEEGLYALLRKRSKGAKKYVLHDGPPYANGDIHMGHALNKILKDIIVKYKNMRGFDAPYVPGWDCHGLPVEHQLFKELKINKHEIDPLSFRKKAAEYAMSFVEKQRAQFKRLGILGDWERPYLTLDPVFEGAVIEVFAKLAEKGSIYQSLRPVHWCTSCETALAEAELEYDEDHVSPSIHVLFPMDPAEAEKKGVKTPADGKISLGVWTTTPWTLVSNVAVALHPDLVYCFLNTRSHGVVAVAESLVERFMQLASPNAPEDFEILAKKKGRDLQGMLLKHPFLDRKSPIVLSETVSHEDGTGAVHIAPGHGMDDHRIGLQNSLPILMPVDEKGRFSDEAGDLRGLTVSKANPVIIETLFQKGMLVHAGEIRHSYPLCWRCKRSVITRATKQWFVSLDKTGLRKKALEAIRKVKWIPAVGENRILGMVESRPDWCLSRQRYWGVPVPVFYCSSCDEAVLDAALIRRVAAIFRKEGSDSWFRKSALDLTGGGWVCPKCGRKDLKKGEDILDVWFESGSSYVPVLLEAADMKFPADLYLEGSDQHRGWFQSSLLVACGIHGQPPYEAVLTHGFIVDGEGKKMSKSIGNALSPLDVMTQYGADILRLWVASSDISDDIRVSADSLARLAEGYRKIRNTLKYLLGNVHGFDAAKDGLPLEKLLEVDRWALSKLESLKETVSQAYESGQFHRIYHEIYNFCTREMSSFYLDVLKDRLYTDPRASISGRSSRTALYEILVTLTKMMAPILSFTCEEVWEHLGQKTSVHLELWQKNAPKQRSSELEQKWENFLLVREKVLKALEEKREKKEIGNSLEAEVELSSSQNGEKDFLKGFGEDLPGLLLVSRVTVFEKPSQEGLEVTVKKATGKKCERCWNYRDTVGMDKDYETLCRRCAEAVKAL